MSYNKTNFLILFVATLHTNVSSIPGPIHVATENE